VDKVLHGAEGVKTKGEINGKREDLKRWSYVSNILSSLQILSENFAFFPSRKKISRLLASLCY